MWWDIDATLVRSLRVMLDELEIAQAPIYYPGHGQGIRDE